MSKREEKQQQWQKRQQRKTAQKSAHFKILRVFCALLWAAGFLCGMAGLVGADLLDWPLPVVILLIYLAFFLFTGAAWLNWYLAPTGYTLDWGGGGHMPRFTYRIPNLWLAVVFSVLTVLLCLTLLSELIREL